MNGDEKKKGKCTSPVQPASLGESSYTILLGAELINKSFFEAAHRSPRASKTFKAKIERLKSIQFPVSFSV